ncbi:BZ3500_MvSof-1268-A1-R1_Chr6-3g08920 [Microbotryum saponariae]|uniref:Aldehyde dehydrogenase n=1 Tax=Microbotryum saponariae TaxID=289078 RepID=A0A2X0NI15_9BASI|nr:BZ3500_MvSof-1268-A1-R1_Chr6-3g08920 [Microbotryum saponariae]SDA07522.1 BZ3501_MvSof-1269-A2-R1_Chr6-2g08624 [Microbotryum saponariae]
MSSDYTPVDQIKPAYDEIVKTFLTGKTRSIKWRKQQLKQLGFLIQDNEAAFIEALRSDLSRPEFETTIAELNPLKTDVNEAYDHLDKWAKPVKAKTTAVWALANAYIYNEPKGAVFIIGTWNYPLVLLLSPLVGAIAAGCTALLKPAEQAPAVAKLVQELLPKYLDTSAYKIILGAVDQVTRALELKFDHIFYTGSGGIGKIIARAAAEHLTPFTLELGGKSPAVVFDDANIDITARRIMWGKFVNSGQTCISPDYVLCTADVQDKLVAAMQKVYKEFTTDTKGQEKSMVNGEGYARIVNMNHFGRISTMLDETKGRVVVGGGRNKDAGKIETTIIADVGADDPLMKGEIFGPVMPIVVKQTKEEMVEFIQERDNPLALYVFTQSTKNRDYIFERTRSGGFVQNDTILHFTIPGLPFGGAGASGIGAYHGKWSFDTFSHQRASAHIPTWMDLALNSRYPPYTLTDQFMFTRSLIAAKKLKMMLLATKAVIKRESKWSLKSLFGVLAVVAAIVRYRQSKL